MQGPNPRRATRARPDPIGPPGPSDIGVTWPLTQPNHQEHRQGFWTPGPGRAGKRMPIPEQERGPKPAPPSYTKGQQLLPPLQEIMLAMPLPPGWQLGEGTLRPSCPL